MKSHLLDHNEDSLIAIKEVDHESTSGDGKTITTTNTCTPTSLSKIPHNSDVFSYNSFNKLMQTKLFINYFNKYNTLAVFGQIIYYDTRTNTHEAVPLPCLKKVNQRSIIPWLFQFRFLRFINTMYYYEYSLCSHLMESHFLKSSDKLVEKSFNFLKQKFIHGVSSMKQFRSFLRSYKPPCNQVFSSGFIIYKFWLDAEQLKVAIIMHQTNWPSIVAIMKQKYSSKNSCLKLPCNILKGMCTNNQAANWDSESILYAQKTFLKHLTQFWMPKYLLWVKMEKYKDTEMALFSLAKKHLKRRDNLQNYPYVNTDLLRRPNSRASSASRSNRDSSPSMYAHRFSLDSRRGSMCDDDELDQSKESMNLEERKKCISFLANESEDKAEGLTSITTTASYIHSTNPFKASRAASRRFSEPHHNFPQSPKNRALVVKTVESEGYTISETSNESSCEFDSVSSVSSINYSNESEISTKEDKLVIVKNIIDDTKLKSSMKPRRSSAKSKRLDNKTSKLSISNPQTFVSQKPSELSTVCSSRSDKNRSLFEYTNKDVRSVASGMITLADSAHQFVNRHSKRLTPSVRHSGLNAINEDCDTEECIQGMDPNIMSVLQQKFSMKLLDPSLLSTVNPYKSSFDDVLNVLPDIANETMSSISVKIKASVASSSSMTKYKKASNYDSVAAIHTRLQRNQDSESDDSDEIEANSFDGVGKSSLKKIKQHRTQRTFFFSLGEIMGENNDDADGEKKKSDGKSVPSTNVSKKKKVTTFELNKQAFNRAMVNKIKQNRSSYNKTKSKKVPKRKMGDRRKSMGIPDAGGVDNESLYSDKFKDFQINALFHGISTMEDIEWRRKAQFDIQGLQTDEYAGFPFRQYLMQTGKSSEIQLLNMWVVIERLRTFTSQLSTDIRSKTSYITYLKAFIHTYIIKPSPELSNSISEILLEEVAKIDQTKFHTDLPIALVRLQRDIFEQVIDSFREYHKSEQDYFTKKILIHKPVAKVTVKFADDKSSDSYSDEEPQFKIMQSSPKIKTRTSRSTRFLIDLNTINSNPAYFKEIPVFSDDNGECNVIETKKPPVYRLPKKQTIKEMFDSVKVEYPAANYHKNDYKDTTRFSYLKPIRYGGVVVNRPTQKPKSIKELLKHPINFEFFRRYLRYNNVESMLLFWRTIESVKTTTSTRQRQIKAQYIMEKYFHDAENPPHEILKCSAPIILEIPNLEIVTTSMLFTAQATILRQIENDWFTPYCDTFIYDQTKSTETPIAERPVSQDNEFQGRIVARGLREAIFGTNELSFLGNRGGIVKCWVALTNWIRAASTFIKAMDTRYQYNLFSNFLVSLSKRTRPGMVTDVTGFSSSSTNCIGDQKKVPHKKVVCGQLITLVNLANDLDFWIETDRFKNLFNNEEYSSQKERRILQKANIIVDCFLEPKFSQSNSSDSSYINVPRDIRECVTHSIRSGIIDMTIFADAVSYIFPVLVHFWKIYREQYAKNVYLNWRTLVANIKENKRKHRKLQLSKTHSNTNFDGSGDSTTCLPAVVGLKNKKIINIKSLTRTDVQAMVKHGEETGSKICYSTSTGVTLLIPPKNAKTNMSETRVQSQKSTIQYRKSHGFRIVMEEDKIKSECSVTDPTIIKQQLFEETMKKKEKDADKAFEIADQKLKKMIREQVVEKRKLVKNLKAVNR